MQYKPVIAERAKEKQREAGGDKKSENAKSLPLNSAEAIETREELAKIAGVGHDTVAKAEKIAANGRTKTTIPNRGRVVLLNQYKKVECPSGGHSKIKLPKRGNLKPVK